MLCENCKKHDATTHIKRVVNGEATEKHLCSQCAQSLGYNDFFDDFSLSIPNIFSSFFGDSTFALGEASHDRCEKCGCTFDDIIKTGKVGCADCYEKFYDRLLPSIQRIHGRAKHAGKIPDEVRRSPKKKEKTTQEKIEDAQSEMKKAIDAQNFEQAAILRDKIKELKGEE